MSFLPIVERELRVAARRKGTYWSRYIAAISAFIIFGLIILIYELGAGRMGAAFQKGPILFGIFSWLSFAFTCSAGVFLTADTLSEEKREGTLGLLFLTDLRGYDVVFGKLMSASLNAVYGLLAAFPVIGIAFLLGGVTGAEFWRLVLVLLNTLFFSLSVSIFVSALSRDAQKAMTFAATLCALFVLLLPAIDWAMAAWDPARFRACFSFFSPQFTFEQKGSTRLREFWVSLANTHLVSWGFLMAASFWAPRLWRETGSKSSGEARSRKERFQFGSPKWRAALRQKWLEGNAVRWLAARNLWMARSQWLVLVGAGILLILLSVRRGGPKASEIYNIADSIFSSLEVFINLWIASQASRFFVEARRTGALELLLVTPLSSAEIVRGQLWALRRTFLWPLLVLLLATTAVNAAQIYETLQKQTAAPGNTSPPIELILFQIIHTVGSLITGITGLIAVAWFGMWMGLTAKKVNVAVIKTIAFVQVIPFIALMFLNVVLFMVLGFASTGRWGIALAQVIITLITVAVDIAFITKARKLLLTRFREMAGGASERPNRRVWPLFSNPVPPVPQAPATIPPP